jgi:capsular polysaccharide biosynthesis protein
LKDADGIKEDARKELKKDLIFTSDKKTKLTSITAKASTPEQSQALGQAAIAFLLDELQLKGQDRKLVQKKIEINANALKIAEEAIESIKNSLKKSPISDQAQESAIKNLSILNFDYAKRAQENEELRLRLEVTGAEIYVQSPSLPQRKTLPKSGQVVLLAFLASGFVLLLFVFIREAWRSAVKDKEAAVKIKKIKFAFVKDEHH